MFGEQTKRYSFQPQDGFMEVIAELFMRREANWIRFNSCSVTFRSKLLKDTWVANRGFKVPSMTE
jgi:hypothetical protein